MQALTEKMNALFSMKRFNLVAFCVIAALVAIAYSNTFTASFHFDDDASIAENASIKQVTLANIQAILHSPRPVVYYSLMLNYWLGGMNVVGYHLFNTAVHILNSFFVFLLLQKMFESGSVRAAYGGSDKRMAFFGALLFAVHPIQTESVTYIISRTELLATFFYMISFLLFVRGAEKGALLSAAGIFVAATCAGLSKEWTVTLPALLFLYDLFFLSGGKMKRVMAHWPLYLASLMTWVVAFYKVDLFSGAAAGAAAGPASIGFNVSTNKGLNAKTFLLTSFNVIWTYLRLLILPIHQNLDYDYPIAKTLFELPTLISFLGHVAVAGGAFWLYWKRGQLLIPFGVAWFYIGLSPVQSFVPIIDVIFEHRLYMPSIGFFLVFIVVYDMLFGWLARRSGSSRQTAEP